MDAMAHVVLMIYTLVISIRWVATYLFNIAMAWHGIHCHAIYDATRWSPDLSEWCNCQRLNPLKIEFATRISYKSQDILHFLVKLLFSDGKTHGFSRANRSIGRAFRKWWPDLPLPASFLRQRRGATEGFREVRRSEPLLLPQALRCMRGLGFGGGGGGCWDVQMWKFR